MIASEWTVAAERTVASPARNGGTGTSEVFLKRYEGGFDVNLGIRSTARRKARATVILSPELARELAALLVDMAEDAERVRDRWRRERAA